MKYEIRLALPMMCWGIVGLITLQASFLCLNLTALICFIISIMAFRLMFGLRTRLNDYFIIIRWPFSKWRNVFQKPDHVSGVNSDLCRYKIRNLSCQMISMFSSPLFQKDYLYRMTTHQTVVNHLKRLEKQDQVKIMTCTPTESKTLKRELKRILKYCWNCPKRESCRWHRKETEPRQFYYVEFQVTRTNCPT